MNEHYYLDPEQTKHHDPLMTQCAEFIINHQGKVISTETLVKRFLGDFTKGKETRVRQAIEEYTNDIIFQKIIISTHDGYIHPDEETQQYLIDDYIETTDKTARSIFFRLGNNLKRLKLNGQCKEQLGRYDSSIYLTFANSPLEPLPERRKEIHPKPPVFDPADEIEDYLEIPQTPGVQVGMRL